MEIYLVNNYTGSVGVTIPGVFGEYGVGSVGSSCSTVYDWLADLHGGYFNGCEPGEDFLALEQDQLYEIIISIDSVAQTFHYFMCDDAATFYCTEQGSSDLIFHIDGDGVLSIQMTSTGGSSDPPSPEEDINQIFGSEQNWIWPHNLTGPYPTNGTSMPESDFFLSRQDAPYTSYLDMHLENDLVVDVDLDASDVTFEFSDRVELIVEGSLDVSNVTFKSEHANPTPSTGWDGIRFEPGSTGTIDLSTISGVGGYGGSSVYINNASPTIAGTTVEQPAGLGKHGIYVTGSSASPHLELNIVRSHSGSGIVITSSATFVRLVQNTVTSNSGTGLIAGFATKPFLSPPLGSTPGPGSFGNTITLNQGGGVDASLSANVYLGWYYYNLYGWHADGYNSILSNGNDGLKARNGASIHAGGSSEGYNKRNRIYGNSSHDVEATGSGSRVYARCDWWDSTTPPFNTAESSGGLVYDDYYLTADPYVSPYAPSCISGGPMPSIARGAQNDAPTDPPREALVRAVELSAESPETALDALGRLLVEDPVDAVTQSVLAEIGVILSREDVAPSVQEIAERLLETAAASGSQPIRSGATRSLVAARVWRGEIDEAISMAEQLTTEPASAEYLQFGYVALSHLYAQVGRDDDALQALENAEAIASDHVDTKIARTDFELRARGSLPPIARRFPLEDSDRTLPDEKSLNHDFEFLPPYPNPTETSVHIAFTLVRPGTVSIAMYDVLGRLTLEVSDEIYAAGQHTVQVGTDGLPAGTYFVRAIVARDDGSMHSRSRPITVVGD